MLTKTIFLLSAAAALIGCAEMPPRAAASNSSTPRHLRAEGIEARNMALTSLVRTAMDLADNDLGRNRAGRHDRNASSPTEIHAAFAAWSERRTVHSVPIARIVNHALATQSRLEAEAADRKLHEVADSEVTRLEAQIYKVFASWPERRAPAEAIPTRRTRTFRAAAATTPRDICGLINIPFVEEVYGAQVTCSTLSATDGGTEVTVTY
jgi:hypothetical protein